MIIRKATLEDLPAILAIYNEAIRNLTATFDLEEKSMADRKVWFNHFGEKHPLLVADVDGEIAGYCGLSPYNTKAAYAKTVEVSIYLSTKHRGKGVGAKLMEAIIHQAKTLDYHTIISGITEGNDPSIKLHEKFGFTLAGTLKEVGFKFGEWQDVSYYQLILD